MFTAIVMRFGVAFIDIIAGPSVSVESREANALVRANGIFTDCMVAANVLAKFAFVSIMACSSIAIVPGATITLVRAYSVDA